MIKRNISPFADTCLPVCSDHMTNFNENCGESSFIFYCQMCTSRRTGFMFAREIGDMLQRALLMQRPLQGPRNKFSSGVGRGGPKEERVKEFFWGAGGRVGGAGGGEACL